MVERQRVTDLLFRDLHGLRSLHFSRGGDTSHASWYPQWEVAMDVLKESQEKWAESAKQFVRMKGSWVNTNIPPTPAFVEKFFVMCEEAG